MGTLPGHPGDAANDVVLTVTRFRGDATRIQLEEGIARWAGG